MSLKIKVLKDQDIIPIGQKIIKKLFRVSKNKIVILCIVHTVCYELQYYFSLFPTLLKSFFDSQYLREIF